VCLRPAPPATHPPQEQNLVEHHLDNLYGSGKVISPAGDVSTVLQAVTTKPPNGSRYYNIPTVWDGKALTVDEASERAAKAGWDKWPSYATPEQADLRYEWMHGLMEKDTGRYLEAGGAPATARAQPETEEAAVMGGGPPARTTAPLPPNDPTGALRSAGVTEMPRVDPEDVPPTAPEIPPEILTELNKLPAASRVVVDPLPIGGIAGERGAKPVVPGTPGYDALQETFSRLGIARPETKAEAATAIENELAGKNRSKYEIMTADPAGGYAARTEENSFRRIAPFQRPGFLRNMASLASIPVGIARGISEVAAGKLNRTTAETAAEAYARPPIKPLWPEQEIPLNTSTMAWLDSPITKHRVSCAPNCGTSNDPTLTPLRRPRAAGGHPRTRVLWRRRQYHARAPRP
jgi:hypothetical protein